MTHVAENTIGVDLVEATIFQHATFAPGTRVRGTDGHYWFFVENTSGADIPVGNVDITEPDFTAAAGGADFETAFEIPDGKYAFVRQVAL